MAAPLSVSGRRRRGFALLFALAILCLLSVFALSFANLTRLERLAAMNVRLQVQAAALAEAGAAQASGEARAAARVRTWIEANDWWANGTVQPVQPAPPPPPAVANPVGIILGTNDYGGADQVQIKSFDVSAKLDVNLTTPNVRRSMELIFVRAGLTAADAVQAATKITDARVAKGALRSRDELKAVVGDDTYAKVRDFITVHSTPHLGPASAGISGDLAQPYEVPAGTCSPVSLNAASEAVLEGVLANIEGRAIELQSEGVTEWLNRPEFAAARGYVAAGGTITIGEPLAKALAKEIVLCRTKQAGNLNYTSMPFGGSFTSWQQFDTLLQELEGRLTGFGAPEHALVMAACRPDARYMAYNPDASRRPLTPTAGLVDKMCVSRLTTSMTLGGSGVLEVTSLGWLTDKEDNGAIASAEVDRVVRVYTPVHVTSQEDLKAAWVSPDEGTYQLLPEHPSQTPDTHDGQLRLTTEHLNPGGDSAFSTAFRYSPDPAAPFAFDRTFVPLRQKGVLAPDGFLVWRRDRLTDGARLDCGANLPASMAKSGAAEFWVKLFGDQTSGTDEALLTIVISDTESWAANGNDLYTKLGDTIGGFSQPPELGAAIKIERFRGRLRATWWYWGSGNPGGVSRFVLTLSEVQQDISSWKPGEWHHVAVAWTNTDQNWAAAAAGNPTTAASVPNDGIQLWVDGSNAAPIEMLDYGTMESNGINSVKYHTGRIISVPIQEGIIVGGYSHDVTAGSDVHSTGLTNAQGLQRYTNATIDDVFLHQATSSLVPRNANLRFDDNSANVRAEFELPVGTYQEVGAVSAEVELPPDPPPPATSSFKATLLGIASSPVPADDTPPFVLRQDQLGEVTNQKVRVGVVLKGDGRASPVVESFTVLLLPPLQVIEEVRDPP